MWLWKLGCTGVIYLITTNEHTPMETRLEDDQYGVYTVVVRVRINPKAF